MTVTVRAVTGPDAVGFTYIEGSIEGTPQVTQIRAIANAALASGGVTIASERAALVAAVEQALVNWLAAQAALEELQ